MQLICISRGTLSGGKDLARRLAKDLDYACLSREEMIDAATASGIHVGKLEMAMIKPSLFNERLAVEREHYRAFITAFLCERAAEGRLVYHGRTGHLLLPGVSHLLRVRVVSDPEHRVLAAMRDLGIDRKKAARYIGEVDEDRRRWVHSMYGVSWEDVGQYDIAVNLEQMSVENAASALMCVAQLPDFQMTPASRKTMGNLETGAKARLALARDERTSRAGFTVRAEGGIVTVAYLPRDSGCARWIPEVLSGLPAVREVRATMATTNILWVQESFSPASGTFREVVEIATKWNAAVELVRLEPGNGAQTPEPPEAPAKAEAPSTPREADGGIEDDREESAADDGGLATTIEELARMGRSGGGRVVRGGGDRIADTLDRTAPYTLVVVGDLFSGKGREAALRLRRELQGFLSDRIKVPVVTTDELKAHFLFGWRDALRLAGFLAAVCVMYVLVFSNQEPVMRFMSGTWGGGKMPARMLLAGAVFSFIPAVAYLYGSVAEALMKLIKME